ncbi:hypothetical protein [Halorussus sp. MSC15.2]|uniref:DUF7269 family protein n=1 Tax=Halorussus sp. MSC15.2 TaxID=2283638 RepID=UPI0013D4C1A5|nr:hypothetical protein [Halorussus sp. MSC15.2]NEU57727.1 hypothetical protein [Halorussus sp. MSC15.2]
MTDGNDHPILTAVGLVAVALGLLMAFVPGFAAAIGTGYAAVTVVGLLALVQAVRVARSRQATEVAATETPDVETVETAPTPGDEFDRTVAELRSGPRRDLIRERADLRETLEAAAITAVADRENCSREQARERLDAGTWTDDRHAASFLGGEDAPSPPVFDRVRLAVSTESPSQYRIRRTADAVARAAGVEPADAESSGSRDDGESGETDPGGTETDGSAETRASASAGTTDTGESDSSRTDARTDDARRTEAEA